MDNEVISQRIKYLVEHGELYPADTAFLTKTVLGLLVIIVLFQFLEVYLLV